VLNGANTPAAYLLLAVDLVLSHWPVSLHAAVPFLGCPELLCVDRQRVAHDNFEYPDFLGLRALEKEPNGLVRLDDLKRRPSRRLSLDQLIGQYAVSEDAELRERLTQLLRRAAERLGPPGDQSDLSDPRLMAVHALNLVDTANWGEVPCTLPDGTPHTAYEYQAPEAEARHFAALQEAAQGRSSDTNMQLAVGFVLDDPPRSSSKFAAAAVEWAQRAETARHCDDHGKDDETMRHRAIVAAATIAIRDGDAELKTKAELWVRRIFARTLQSTEDRVLRFRSELRYNAIGTAFVGIAHLVKESASPDDVRALLELAGRDDPAAAHGFGASVHVLAQIDERLPRSLLRCALTAAIRPRHTWNESNEEMRLRSESREHAVQAAIGAELQWLANQRSEPNWPEFPSEMQRPRSPIVLPGSRHRRGRPVAVAEDLESDYYVDYQGAALWLCQIARLGSAVSHPWMLEIARTYSSWSATANGAGLEADDEISSSPREWNDAYFNLLANCLPVVALTDVDKLALEPIRSLPDESFFDVVTIFQKSVDAVYFNDRGLDDTAAQHIRAALADRLTASRGWKRVGTGRLGSIETHIGPAIGVLFFNDYGLLTPAKCYLLPEAISRIQPFLAELETLVSGAPSLFVALVTLNLMEVAPKGAHAPFLIAAAESWLERFHSESEFWVDHGIGRRVCLWIEAVCREPSCQLTGDPLRARTVRLIAALVNLGVAEAKQLEEALQ